MSRHVRLCFLQKHQLAKALKMTVLIFSVRVSALTHHYNRYMVNTVVKIVGQVCVKIIASCSSKHIVSCISFPTLGIKKKKLISSRIDKVVCF